MVSAAAGFGKTSLLKQWYEIVSDHGITAAWLTLESSDSERLKFVASLLVLLRSVDADAGGFTLQLLEAQSEPDLDEVLDRLCEDFSGLREPSVFFIDEYDWVDAPGTNQVMETLLLHTPEHVSFVMAARSQPCLPISRMKLRDTVRIIAAEDLCFSLDEASEFLNRVHNLGLTIPELESIYDKTEGWVAGLQLVMLSLRDRDSVDEVLPGLSGEFRDIADYLANDVLERQPLWLQNFMFRTSVLTKINSELASLLTGREDAQAILEKLEDANLFLSSVDVRRQWYRYHNLFREFLLSRLRKAIGIDERGLLELASDWYERNDMPDEAVQCALDAGQEERAVRLVESYAESMITQGQVRQVIRWINLIPPKVAQGRLRLQIIQVWVLFHLGRIQQGKSVLQQVVRLAKRQDHRESGMFDDSMQEEVLTLEACLASCGEDGKTIRRLVRDSGHFSTSYAFLSGTRANALAAGCYSLGHYDRCMEYALRGEQLHVAARSTYGEVMARSLQGLVAYSRGQLDHALDRFTHAETTALQEAGPLSYCCAITRCLKAAVYYYQFDLDAARPLIEQNLSLISGCGYVEIWRLAGTLRARILAFDHMWTQADEVMRRSVIGQQEEVSMLSRALILDERIRTALRADDVDSAMDLALKHGLSLVEPTMAPRDWHRERCLYLSSQGRLFLAMNEPELALRCIRPLRKLALRDQRQLCWIEHALLEAAALSSLTRAESAADVIIPALEYSAVHNIIAPFVEDAPLLCQLLQNPTICNSMRPGFLKSLQFAIPKLCTNDSGRQGLPPRLHGLTDREFDVLRLLASGLGNREISFTLGISENTVKWHVRNILEKFCVDNRMKAVVLARESGYL
tara:strand:+ start:38434 stop:41013 length:2580 start_codon:yes stop_codon:yes gene_type:complete